jgi:hypothetical protein
VIANAAVKRDVPVAVTHTLRLGCIVASFVKAATAAAAESRLRCIVPVAQTDSFPATIQVNYFPGEAAVSAAGNRHPGGILAATPGFFCCKSAALLLDAPEA